MSKILIVDNNEHIVKMLNEVLSRDGHRIDQAMNAAVAFELIDNNRYDIAFVDLELPDGSGLNILCYIKKQSQRTVTIVISGKSDINYAIEAIKAGVFRYLKKPFDLDDILGIASQAIDENRHRVKAARVLKSIKFPVIVKLFSDLLTLVPSLLIGFLAQQKIYSLSGIPFMWAAGEVIYPTLSFICCYAFIFITNLGYNLREHKANSLERLRSYTWAYVLYAAILFLAADFGYGKLVLVTGYMLGVGGLWLSRSWLLPKLERIISPRREGQRRLIWRGTHREKPRPAPALSTSGVCHDNGNCSFPGNTARSGCELAGRLNDLKADEKDLGDDWGSRLIRDFQKNRLRRNRRRELEEASR